LVFIFVLVFLMLNLGLGLGLVLGIGFSALHEMPERTSDEKGVCLSVCPSLRLSNAWIVTKRKKDLSRFLYMRKII